MKFKRSPNWHKVIIFFFFKSAQVTEIWLVLQEKRVSQVAFKEVLNIKSLA